MSPAEAKEIHLAEYQTSTYDVPNVKLHFDLQSAEHVRVTNQSDYTRTPRPNADDSLTLHGNGKEFCKLITLRIRGNNEQVRDLEEGKDYHIDPQTGNLTIDHVPNAFTLEVITDITPGKNKEYSGLYTSEGVFCTQCESEGFRNITYCLDRPDVLSSYDVTIDADKAAYPYLLSNGVPVEEAIDIGGGRHRFRWVDARPKPSYLFALVGGNMDEVKGTYTYPNGESVDLRYYVNKGDAHKATFALKSMQRALQHEYERWGHKYHSLNYDNNLFMTVAIDAFNMGAMENTGLNIFNSALILADPHTSTDHDFFEVDAVINHEFDHDETGNWGVPREWFQISFKEGLTVFRDQTYTADRYGETLQRINDVQREIRSLIIPYDEGPFTHPMVLNSYSTPNNNYDVLTYPKGAEVNRMLQTLIGKKAYQAAYRDFFNSEEPRITTIDEYFQHIAQHSGKDLSQFINSWIHQAGIPTLHFSGEYDASKQTYRLKVEQRLPQTADSPNTPKQPFHLPLKMGLMTHAGQEIAMQPADSSFTAREDGMIEITKRVQYFTFKNVPEKPLLSLNRDHSAYAKITYAKGHEPSLDDLVTQAAHDSNIFKRWDALQELGMTALTEALQSVRADEQPVLDSHLLTAFKHVLADRSIDDGVKAKMLQLPPEAYFSNLQGKGAVDPIAIRNTYDAVKEALAVALLDDFKTIYDDTRHRAHPVDRNQIDLVPEEMKRRMLMNTCLGYLVASKTPDSVQVAKDQFDANENFNDAFLALSQLVNSEAPEATPAKQNALARMYESYKADKLVMNKWLSVQAASDQSSIESVKNLTEHSAFDKDNPNKLRAVLGGFLGNAKHFHNPDGSGYAFMADWICSIDQENGQIAARFASRAFGGFAQYEPECQEKMLEQVRHIRDVRGERLSPSLNEILTKIEKDARHQKLHTSSSQAQSV